MHVGTRVLLRWPPTADWLPGTIVAPDAYNGDLSSWIVRLDQPVNGGWCLCHPMMYEISEDEAQLRLVDG